MMLRNIALVGVMAAALGATVAYAESKPAGDAVRPVMDWHKDMCTNHFAHTAGRLAFLAAKLDLTAEQRPAWDKWHEAVMSGAERQRAVCLEAAPAKGAPPSVVERMAHLQLILATKAESLKTSQPALEALYQTLTPAQKAVFDHPLGMHHRFMWHGGWQGHGADGGPHGPMPMPMKSQ